MSLPLDVQSDLGLLAALLLAQLLDRQQHGDVDHLVEVPRDPIEFCEHVLAQRRASLRGDAR